MILHTAPLRRLPWPPLGCPWDFGEWDAPKIRIWWAEKGGCTTCDALPMHPTTPYLHSLASLEFYFHYSLSFCLFSSPFLSYYYSLHTFPGPSKERKSGILVLSTEFLTSDWRDPLTTTTSIRNSLIGITYIHPSDPSLRPLEPSPPRF